MDSRSALSCLSSRRFGARTGATLAAGLMLILPGVGSASAIGRPAHLQVTRVGADLSDLSITWSPVPGVDHYTVSVFDGQTDHVGAVAKDATSYTFDGSGNCTRYRVTVAAVAADGSTAVTGEYWVAALAPGAVHDLKWNGKGDEQPSQLSWSPPAVRSEKPVAEYGVQVTRMSDGHVVLSTTTTELAVALPGLDSNRLYKARVQALNAFGTCASPTLMLRGAKTTMTPPRTLRVSRTPAVPATANVSWARPEWTGSAEVTGYEVAYSTAGSKQVWTMISGADTTSTKISLDPAKTWDFQVRAVGTGKASPLTKPVTLVKVGGTGIPELDPAVTIKQSGKHVVVDINGPVGSSSKYPKLDVRIAPTLGTKGFRDDHLVTNRATKVQFSGIPCDVYTVLVTGQGSGATKEFGRSVLDICDSGVMTPADWKLISGTAKITDNSVAMTGYTRVLSTRPRTSQDMVFTSDINFTTGNGYGVWTRSTWEAAKVTHGYTFQYDPGWGNQFIIRLWQNDQECGTPLGATKFPAGMTPYGRHHIVVVTSGNSMYATVDGVRMFDVPSLTQAITTSKCTMDVPAGTQIGMRTWSTTEATFTDTTIR